MTHAGFGAFRAVLTQNGGELWYTCNRNISRNDPQKEETQMKRKDLARRATSAALAACMMFTLSAPALAESTDALMQLSIGSYRSTSLLSEENSLPAIKVNGKTVTETNKGDILGGQDAGKLRYDATTNTLTLKSNAIGSIMDNLTIDAPGVNIELNNTSNPVVFGKLTVTNAASVKVTSQNYCAVFGAVEISCDGEVEITCEEGNAVTNNVTVKRASKVAISGKNDINHIVTGDVKIECNVPVTIQNNSTGGMANSITCSGEYVYSYTVGGARVDPSTPIDASKNAVYITPVAARTITVTNGKADKAEAIEGETVTVTPNDRTAEGYQFVRWDVVSGITDAELNRSTTDNTATFTMPGNAVKLWARYNKLYTVTTKDAQADVTTGIPGTKVTVTANVPAGEKFTGWKVECTDSDFKYDESGETVTFKMPKANVTVTAEHKTPRTVTVTDGNGTVKGLTPHGTDHIFAGDTVEVTAKELPGKLFDHWECAPELTDPSDNPLTEAAKKNNKVTFKMPQGDVTLTAVYKEAKSFTLKHGTILSVTRGGVPVKVTDNMELFAGDTVTITPNNRLSEKRLFDRWVVKSDNVKLNGTKTATFTMPDAPVELEAVYNNLYTVTVNDGTATDTINHIAGDTVTVKANVPAGEKFTGWKVENNTALSFNDKSIDLTQPEITFTMPSTNITLTAEHKTIHTLTVVDGTIDGSTTGNTIQAIAGDTITVHSKLTADQQFLHWKSEGMGLTDSQAKSDPLTIKMPDGDVTITAVPKQLYTVTVVNGKVHDQSADTANPGDTVTINADDRTALGEVFVGWTVKSTNAIGQPNVKLHDPTAESTTFTMVGANVEVEAKYKTLHTVTVWSQMEGEQPTENTDLSQKKIEGKDISVAVPGTIGEDWIFDHWEVEVGGYTVTDLFDYSKPVAEFKMQDADVKLTAVYRKLYTITIINNVNDDVVNSVRTTIGDTVHLDPQEIHGWRFKSWTVTYGDAKLEGSDLTLVSGGNVVVKAEYVKLYDLTVNYGTAVNKTVETETTTDGDGRIVLPAADGDKVTVNADKPTMETFEGWTLTADETVYDENGSELTTDEEGYILNADGTRLTELSFTFVMPAGGVNLKANYSMPAYVMPQWVTVEGGTASAEGEAAAAEISADPGKRITVSADPNADSNMIFDYWEVTSLDEDGKATVKLDDATSMTTSFTMPMAPVELTAHWRTIDEAPSSDGGGAGAAIAGVAIGGAAVWGGYEIATRIILNDLLPAGAAIPANRGQLALLIWTEKGKPEPAAQPAFADITDAELAKAAQWCVEQGLLDAREGKFEPDGWMPKFKTIEIWNKAFPKK